MQKFLNKAKSKLDSFQQQQQSSQSAQSNTNNPPPIPTASKPHKQYSPSARLAWPPRLESLDVLGEIKDTSNRNIPRDLGRSITLGGKHFYLFADTFCFSHSGDFAGLTSNTCAYIPDINNPTKCTYWNQGPKEPEFIPFTREDEEYNKRKKGTDSRVANWAFGGVIEDGLNGEASGGGKVGSGKGWMFCDRNLIRDGESVCVELVRVELVEGNKLKAEKILGASPFKAEDERFGNLNTFIDGGYVYLLGHSKHSSSKWPRNVLARIPYGSDFTQKSNYTYYTNSGWSPTYTHSDDLADVMSEIGHGMVMKIGEKGPPGKPYMCIGVDQFMTSNLYIGVAEKPEGPWDVKSVGMLPKYLGENSKIRYALFCHEWGSDLNQGEMLVSWSDDGQMGGLVVAGRLRLAMEE